MTLTGPVLASLLKGALSNWRGSYSSSELDNAVSQLLRENPSNVAEVVQILTDTLGLEGAGVLAATEVAPEVLVLLAV